LTAWDEQVAHARDELLEEFDRAGFAVRSSTRIEGEIAAEGRPAPVPVDITLPEGFPYEPPAVRPIDGTGGLSWHANRDGSLCLWAAEDAGDLPWLRVGQIVGRVQEWFRNDAVGWVDDTPDLDLERYWPGAEGLVVYPDLDGIAGKFARAKTTRGVWQLRPGPAPVQGRQRLAAVVDVGDLERPIRSFDDIVGRAGDLADRLTRGVTRGRVEVLLVRYWRGRRSAVLALVVRSRRPVELVAVAAAHDGDATLHLRSGPDRDTLQAAAVTVVGVGAVGSQVADLLARAGVGNLTVVDHDIVRPGNLIRHTAGADWIGRPKVDAVKVGIDAGVADVVVTARQMWLRRPTEAAELLTTNDVVVDATANGLATRLLLDGANALGQPVVSVCLVRDGQVARVDRFPLRDGETHGESTTDLPDRPEPLREGGCGDPVSPAPMWAATAAASRAVGMVVDLLTSRRQYPPSVVDVLVAGEPDCTAIGTRP
jgi:molybdopterin/thiamine biosynthesis adenylyltransferase